MPWKTGFPEDTESYRSRVRAKKRKEIEEADRLRSVERKNEVIYVMLKEQQKQLDEMRQQGPTHQRLEESAGVPSQRRSSVASMAVEPIDRYPVDNITKNTRCELHVGVMNLSFKAALGYALSCEPEARWHGKEIPDGYAIVGVD